MGGSAASIGPALERRGFRYVVITELRAEVDSLRARRIAAIYGDAANHEVLDARPSSSERGC